MRAPPTIIAPIPFVRILILEPPSSFSRYERISPFRGKVLDYLSGFSSRYAHQSKSARVQLREFDEDPERIEVRGSDRARARITVP
jgi:hypothetical protein